jgi:hypothetical protein
MDDYELAGRIGAIRQVVRQLCRKASRGAVRGRPNNKIEHRTGTGRNECWIIFGQVRGGQPQQQGNYLLGALGELVQRMDDFHASTPCRYSTLPGAMNWYARLPDLARQRLSLMVSFQIDAGVTTRRTLLSLVVTPPSISSLATVPVWVTWATTLVC